MIASNPLHQIPSQLLLPLNGFEQGFEVSRTKTGEVVALNDFNEDSWSIHQMLSPLANLLTMHEPFDLPW
jgi:hypothetical protein